MDVKARVALKTDRSVFNTTLALRSKQEATSKTPKGNAEIASRLPSKKQTARSKVPTTKFEL